MKKSNLKEILTIANANCREKYGTSLYDKVGLKIEDEDDLVDVLSFSDLEEVMSSGRVGFNDALYAAVASILVLSVIPMALFGTIAGMSRLLQPDQKNKKDAYKDIIRQLYSNRNLYEAIKEINDTDISNQDAAEELMSVLGY